MNKKLLASLTVLERALSALRDLAIVVLIAALLAGEVPPIQVRATPQKVDDCMAVEFGQSGSYLEYPAAAAINNVTPITVMMWWKPTAFMASGFSNTLFSKQNHSASPSGWELAYYGNAANLKLRWAVGWSGNNGIWDVLSLTLNAGTWYHLAVTYDKSLTTNDPIMYVNGTSRTVTEILAPTGTADDESAQTLHISELGVSNSAYGNVAAALIYNRILSASEILEAYNSRLAVPFRRGLVFAPNLCQPTPGLLTGAALTAAAFPDMIAGAKGTPTGSPLFKGDDLLTFQGMN